MDYLSDLNEAQLRAVQHTEGYLRVIAGAGSGKTKMLVARYAYLVDVMGVNPGSILCVTFTNKAAGEMRRRVREIIGEGFDTSLICTYHGFCARLLREDIEKIFYPSSFQIIDEEGQYDLLADIYERFELKLDYASFKKVAAAISEYKGMNDYVPQMISREPILTGLEPGQKVIPQQFQIIQAYLEKQKQTYCMDFDDLIWFALYELNNCPDVREKWQKRLNYIQIDEFQDSASEEMELVDILSGYYGNMMVVGDPDQNIYEWRGSKVRLLVDFDRDHIPTTTVTLEQNYRSTSHICNCANSLIANNTLRVEKNLIPIPEHVGGPMPIHLHAATEAKEVEWIANKIKELQRGGLRYSDIAILYRAGFLSRAVERALVEGNLPYEVFGGVRFYRRMEILDIIAYLRFVVFEDDLAFKRIANKPARRFGRVRMGKLEEMAPEGTRLVETLRRHIDDPAFRGSRIGELLQFQEQMKELLGKTRVPEFVDAVCKYSGYETYLRELGDMERFDNLTEFKRVTQEYVSRYGEEVTLSNFLDYLALQTDDEFQREEDKIKLMTIHASKGLEFPAVFIVGFSEGIFPSSRTIEQRKVLGLEEERRLCYVALTRAEQHLFITDSEGASEEGRNRLPSRFLDEIGTQNYERVGVIPKELEELSKRFIERHTPDLIEPDSVHKKQVVEHPVFGTGEVRSIDDVCGTCEVWFDSLGQTRTLSISFITRDKPKIAALPVREPASKKPEPTYAVQQAPEVVREVQPAAALQRERDLINTNARVERSTTRTWRVSKKGNEYLKVDDKMVVVFQVKSGKWGYAYDEELGEDLFATSDEAKRAAFEKVVGL